MPHKCKSFMLLSLVICIAAVITGVPGSAQGSALLQLGTSDNSPAEFALNDNYKSYAEVFPKGVTYEAGKSDLAKDWPAVQPGPVADWKRGHWEQTQAIVFDLDEQPVGPLNLHVNLLDTSRTHPPTVRINVNHKEKNFRLEPGNSDEPFSGKGKPQQITMPLAGGFLNKGRNIVRITLTHGSWIAYDSISIEKCDSVPVVLEELELESTCLFKQDGDELKQIVEARMDLYGNHDSIRIKLRTEDGLEIEQIMEDIPSGRREFEIEVPSIIREQAASVTAYVGGQEFTAKGAIRPEKHWKIFIIPSTHFDYGYTDIQPETMRVHRENLERAIDWCTEYPDFVWNLEASVIAEDYLKNGSRPEDFLRLAGNGRIGVQGFYANPLTGIASGEELSRYMDFYSFLKNKYGVESKCALQNDVPTMVSTVPMILNGHGIKYLSHGQNRVRVGGHQEMDKTPYYWESPDGSRVLAWKIVGGYAQAQWMTGTDDAGNFTHTRSSIKKTVSEFSRRDYPYDATLLHGAFSDNRNSVKSIASIPDQWNRIYAYPKLVLCRGSEFFEYIEANFADQIPVFRGDGGVYWEDGAGSSAYETAITRVAKEQLLSAEKLTALCGSRFQGQVKDRFQEAWNNILLYDEHTWGANVSVDKPEAKETIEQWAVKKGFADQAAELAQALIVESAGKFAAGIQTCEDSVLVFNPSGWIRSEVVSFTNRDGKAMTLQADAVPAFGYKVYPLAHAVEEIAKPVEGDSLENAYYRVEFDQNTGAVKSIFDKELNRELVDYSSYGVNAYLYVTNFYSKESDLVIERCAGASLEKSAIPGRQVMRVTSKAPMTRSFSSEVVLYDNQKRIDFINRLDKEANLAKESGYFAFPFHFKNPDVRLEIPHGVMRPEKDQFDGACRDWYAVQHFLTVADDTAAVAWTALDSPLVTLQDINREKFQRQLNIENGHLFAYVFNNLWFTNYKASQDGPLTFRFSMTSARRIADTQAKWFGESVQSPMVCQVILGTGRNCGNTGRGFVSVDANSVLLQAVKPARFSNGTIIRLREMNGRDKAVQVTPNGIAFRKAYLCNLAEEKIGELAVNDGRIDIPCKALGLTTVLLER